MMLDDDGCCSCVQVKLVNHKELRRQVDDAMQHNKVARDAATTALNLSDYDVLACVADGMWWVLC